MAVGTPARTFYARDLAQDVRAKALDVCNAAGVKPGPLLDACTLDVAVIGQDAAAKVFVGATDPAAVGTIVGPPSTGRPGLWVWLLLLLVVFVLVVWWFLRKK